MGAALPNLDVIVGSEAAGVISSVGDTVSKFSVSPPSCTKHLGTYSDRTRPAQIALVRHSSLSVTLTALRLEMSQALSEVLTKS